ncbi:MAG: hypothetical protein MZU91_02265 [Desulfosudis oleivorans]|nr:hypothetical protein [Desulfosudis oleivorans]
MLTDLIPMVDEYDHDEWLKQINEWKAEGDSRSIMNWPDDGKLYVRASDRRHLEGDGRRTRL